jgi:hypothetical protein
MTNASLILLVIVVPRENHVKPVRFAQSLMIKQLVTKIAAQDRFFVIIQTMMAIMYLYALTPRQIQLFAMLMRIAQDLKPAVKARHA